MRRTLRMRLALVYSGLFFVSGVLMLAIVVALFKGGSSQTAPGPDQPIPEQFGP